MTAVPPRELLSAGTASAPGDLPWSHVVKREALKAEQFRHDNTLEPRRPGSGDAVTVTATSGAGLGLVAAAVVFTTDGSPPDGGSPSVVMDRRVEWAPATGYVDVWSAVLPPQPDGTVVRYRITGSDTGGRRLTAHDGSGFWFREGTHGLTTFAYFVSDEPIGRPGWLRDAVIYQVFLDRFRSDEGQLGGSDPAGKHGGTLRGVTDALPYLDRLGVDCLWLSPVGPSPTYHRYDQLDFLAVDDDLGGLAAARELVTAAHERGIRLVLDFVPSHTSHLMPEFLAAQADRDAASFGWFAFDEWPGEYRAFLGDIKTLPSFDGNDEGLRAYLNESVAFWLGDVGFDGLRLDHAIGHGSDFWVQFIQAALVANPEAAIFGEVTDTVEMLRRFEGQLPGILDFPLANALRSTFGTGEWSVAEFATMARAYDSYMTGGPERVTFLDNHDMDRFLLMAGDDTRRLRMAVLFLLTLPHPPVLYYGTEIGLSQAMSKDEFGFGGDHLVRADMPWDRTAWDEGLLTFVTAAVALRKEREPLRRGEWAIVEADERRGLLRIRVAGAGDGIDLVCNLSDTEQTATVRGRVLLATEPVEKGGDGLVMPALSAAVLEVDGTT